MVKHTQTIRRQQQTNCLSVFDHFVGLALKGLTDDMYFQWIQMKDTISNSWKEIVKQENSVNNNLLIIGHHVIKAEWCLSIDKLNSKEL